MIVGSASITRRCCPRANTCPVPSIQAMLCSTATTGEKSSPIWFPQGFRLNADAYIDALSTTLVPWMKSVASAHRGSSPTSILFQQDGAPPTQPNYCIWLLVTAGTVGSPRSSSVAALKRRVNTAWQSMDPDKNERDVPQILPVFIALCGQKWVFFLTE